MILKWVGDNFLAIQQPNNQQNSLMKASTKLYIKTNYVSLS